MKTLSTHVELSSQEQSKGSKQIAGAIEHISEMVRQLHQAQSEQARGSEQLLAAVEQLRSSQFRQIEILENGSKVIQCNIRDITERKRAEHEIVAAKDEISGHAEKLEKTVVKRTAELRETIGELELGWRSCELPVIAITGTNGKTTTTELIAQMLNACGQRTIACGSPRNFSNASDVVQISRRLRSFTLSKRKPGITCAAWQGSASPLGVISNSLRPHPPMHAFGYFA